ncbi:MAG TPA: class I SAM-dependent methyltransferase [Propionibacteriaceae bacterium]|nr:class I SAM-dependent methyltransferase [Propionibacteriaceae bacterium]
MTATDAVPAQSVEGSTEAFADKIFTALLGTMETFGLYLGERLGWLTALAAEPLTPAELAAQTQTAERYAVEWLEMQAVYGNVVVIGNDAEDPASRRYALPPAAAEVLTDEHSLSYLGALPRMFAAVGLHLEDLLTAYRTGGGVSWAQLGADARESQAATNRPWFETELGPALAGVPEVHAVLSAPGCRIADVGCGEGWSTLALARAYPEAAVTGIDLDEPSVAAARVHAEEAGLSDRVGFSDPDGAGLDQPDAFDAAFIFEALHDMPRPVEVLAAVRRAVGAHGLVVIMDEAVADEFTAPGDVVERAMYGYSTLICLPDGLSSSPSAGTGTVMRRSVLTAYATAAGFAGVDVLPIQDFAFFRFYRLHRNHDPRQNSPILSES